MIISYINVQKSKDFNLQEKRERERERERDLTITTWATHGLPS